MSDTGQDFKDTQTADVQYSMLQETLKDWSLSVFAKYKILRNAQKRGIGIGMRLDFSEKEFFKEKLYEATLENYYTTLKRLIPPETKWSHDSIKDTIEEFIKAFNALFKTKNKFDKLYNIQGLKYLNGNATLGSTSLLYLMYTMGIREYSDEDFITLFTDVTKNDRSHVHIFDLFRYIRYFTNTEDIFNPPMFTNKFKVFSTDTDVSDTLEDADLSEIGFTNLEVEMQPEQYYVTYVINNKYTGKAILYDVEDPIDNIMYQIMYAKNLSEEPFLKSYLTLERVEQKYQKPKRATEILIVSDKQVEIGGDLMITLDSNYHRETWTSQFTKLSTRSFSSISTS